MAEPAAAAPVDMGPVDTGPVDTGPVDIGPLEFGPFDAVVLAGGAARRLGGADKAALTVAGTSLLDRVLAAVEDAEQVIVVGPVRPVSRNVLWAREQPPGGGPVAGLAAGLALVSAPVVAVLAVDLPFLRPAHVQALRRALVDGKAGGDAGGAARGAAGAAGGGAHRTAGEAAGAVLIDDEGADQVLAGVWRSAALRGALPPVPAEVAMRRLVGDLPLRRVALPGRPWCDVDSPADLAAVRSEVTEAPEEGGR